jgi:hypothetical protein
MEAHEHVDSSALAVTAANPTTSIQAARTISTYHGIADKRTKQSSEGRRGRRQSSQVKSSQIPLIPATNPHTKPARVPVHPFIQPPHPHPPPMTAPRPITYAASAACQAQRVQCERTEAPRRQQSTCVREPSPACGLVARLLDER